MIEPTTSEPRQRRFSCLIVEDDKAFASMAAEVVREEAGEPTVVFSLAGAREAAGDHSFDLVLLDNHLPDGKGYDFFEQLARRNPDAPVIMITGMPDLGEAVSLTRNGLFEYLVKPISVDDLSACLRRAGLRLATRETPAGADPDLFDDSPAMQEVMAQLRQAARHASSTILLTGETGTGKDLAAQVLHQLTFAGKSAPFVAVNCGAIPAEVFESELFGAERGAYTGADKRRLGLVGAASGGTLFLDEIAEVPTALQAKLLRLLEAREFRALGTTEAQTFSGRFVAATNRNLAEEVKAGRFREDLLYRLDVFAIGLPPLRRRRSDIPGLAELLLSQLARKYSRAKPLIRPEDLLALAGHNFPGNVRELRNVLERSLLRTEDESHCLLLDLSWLNRNALGTTAAPVVTEASLALKVHREGLSPIEAEEYRLIREALRETHGGIRRAASKLGLSPQALLRRLEKWPELRDAKETA
jgi:DNA-binding NtrC family response regulator